MSSASYMVPWLLGALVFALLCLLAWGLWHARHVHVDDVQANAPDTVLAGLLTLAMLAGGMFLIYVLLGPSL